MYTDMELTGASTSNATNDLRPATQGQSVRPKSTAVRRTQPQWLASARSKFDDTSLPDPPHNTILTLAGQRQGNRTVTFLDEDEHASIIPPVNFRSSNQGTSRHFSSDDAQKMFEDMLAKYSHDQTVNAQSAEKKEMQAMKQTLHDLAGSLKSLTSKIELMSLERDHQFQSSPITRVPEYTLSDFRATSIHPSLNPK